MARSTLTNISQDVISDGGAVLWSLVTGEQLEFPILLNFVEDATLKETNNYVYEAVVIEAANTPGQTERPLTLQTGGVQTTLNVRAPVNMGLWQDTVAYNKEDVVFWGDRYYKLVNGAGIFTYTPDLDPRWVETSLNKIYVQFPKELGSTWAQKATVQTSVYGFIELRVTEPADPIFTRTWKPIRGMVELLFSPTDEVADL